MEVFNKAYIIRFARSETVRMIDFIYRSLWRKIDNSFKLIIVSPPIFDANASTSILNFESVTRSINIDLIDDYTIITFYQLLSRWAQKSIINYDIKLNEGLLFQDNSIWRDLIPNPKISQHKSYLHIEFMIDKDKDKLKELSKFTNIIYEIIYKIAQELEDEYKIINIFPKNIEFIESQLLENEFPNLSSSGKESEIVQNLKAFILMEPSKTLLSGIKHATRSDITYDDNYYNEIHLLNTIDGSSINVASIAYKLWGESLQKAIKRSYIKNIADNSLLKEISNDKTSQSIEIRINLFKLYLVLLNKGHIAEVQPNVLSKKAKELKDKNMIEPL